MSGSVAYTYRFSSFYINIFLIFFRPANSKPKVSFDPVPQVSFPSTSGSHDRESSQSNPGPSKPPVPKIRMLNFEISFKDTVIPHVVEDNRTVGKSFTF